MEESAAFHQIDGESSFVYSKRHRGRAAWSAMVLVLASEEASGATPTHQLSPRKNQSYISHGMTLVVCLGAAMPVVVSLADDESIFEVFTLFIGKR